jgi:energy-coupling factor transporter ATP-binding protein EcfA2
MTIQNTLIQRASSLRASTNLQALIEGEASKGCSPEISVLPVSIEPPFISLTDLRATGNLNQPDSIANIDPNRAPISRYRVHIGPDYQFNSLNTELFLKQLSSVDGLVVFEIIGNSEQIAVFFSCHEKHIAKIGIGMAAELEHCVIQNQPEKNFFHDKDQLWSQAAFQEYHPVGSYIDLMTSPVEFGGNSAIQSLLIALGFIQPPIKVWFQVIFKAPPLCHPWHKNVEILQDIQFSTKLLKGIDPSQKTMIQSPSGGLQNMSMELKTKTPQEKPLYHVAFRLCVIGGDNAGNQARLEAVKGFSHLFSHGGRPFDYLCDSDYKQHLDVDSIKNMFFKPNLHCHGFLINSFELAALVHLPSLTRFDDNHTNIEYIKTSGIEMPAISSNEGITLGIANYGGKDVKICIPDSHRSSHVRVIGRTGSGKSTLLENMILRDIHHKTGFMVIDDQGDLINKIINNLPRECVARAVYLNFAHQEETIQYNPLHVSEFEDVYVKGEGIVLAIKSFIEENGWGDRLEYILRACIFSLLKLDRQGISVNLNDIQNLLLKNSKKIKSFWHSRRDFLLKAIIDIEDNSALLRFWKYEFPRYRPDETAAIAHKLGKLLFGNLSDVLSLYSNAICFRKFMDNKNLVFVDLTSFSSMQKSVMGCFLLMQLHSATLGRALEPLEKRTPFHVYIDEAYKYSPQGLENILVESRKFGVGYHLFHQYIDQFDTQKKEALKGVGTNIIFKVGTTEATKLAPIVYDKYSADDLINLLSFHAIARIDTEIVKFKTLPPIEGRTDTAIGDEIKNNSYQSYYASKEEIKQCKSNLAILKSIAIDSGFKEEDLKKEEYIYEEF